jgi:hypothetical protein
MSQNSHLYRRLSVFVLLSLFVLASLPAQALPIHHPHQKVAALGEGVFAWVRNLLASLGLPGMPKEGVMIDPDGVESPEGMSIDPNGRS